MAEFLRVYNYFTREPLAEIWPEEGDSVTWHRPFMEKFHPEPWRYAHVEKLQQKVLTAKSNWLDPT